MLRIKVLKRIVLLKYLLKIQTNVVLQIQNAITDVPAD